MLQVGPKRRTSLPPNLNLLHLQHHQPSMLSPILPKAARTTECAWIWEIWYALAACGSTLQDRMDPTHFVAPKYNALWRRRRKGERATPSPLTIHHSPLTTCHSSGVEYDRRFAWVGSMIEDTWTQSAAPRCRSGTSAGHLSSQTSFIVGFLLPHTSHSTFLQSHLTAD